MTCDKCKYEYGDELPACPLCGEPRGSEPAAWQNQTPQTHQHVQQRPYVQQQYAAYGAQQPTEGLSGARSNAVVSLVCAILGIVIPVIGIVLAIIATVLGGQARKKLPEQERGLASAGFALGIAGIVIAVILIIMLIVVLSLSFTLASLSMDGYFDNYYDDYWSDGYDYYGGYYGEDYSEYDEGYWDGYADGYADYLDDAFGYTYDQTDLMERALAW